MALAKINAGDLWTKIYANPAVNDHTCYLEGVTLVKPVRVVNLVQTVTQLDAVTELSAAATPCPPGTVNDP